MRYATPAVVVLLLCVGAGPATQPDAYPAMQKRLAALKSENDDLRAKLASAMSENATLKSKAAAMASAIESQKPPAEGKADERFDEVRIGMSVKAMGKYCGSAGYLVRESVEGKVYRIQDAAHGSPGNYTMFVCVFDADDRLVSYIKQ